MGKVKEKRLSRFREEWLQRQDDHGDRLAEYILQVDDWNSSKSVPWQEWCLCPA